MFFAAACTPFSPSLHMIGDSTMANKANPQVNPEWGWGQALDSFLMPGITLKNHAQNGKSTKSFIDEGLWDKVLADLKPGDYLVIQFGHNDGKTTNPQRYTNPYTAYRRNLTRFVQEARAAGARPIMLSSVARRNFIEEGTLVDTHGAYPFVARVVADELRIPFIDMQLLTEEAIAKLGPEESKKWFLYLQPGESEMFPEGKSDNTHFNKTGAHKVAEIFVNAVVGQNLPLKKFMKSAKK